MKIGQWVSTILFCMIATSCVGPLIPEQKANLQSANARIDTLITGHEAGTLTTEEFVVQMKAIKTELKEARVSATDAALYGGIAGIAGRTTLHALRYAAPMIPGPFGGILGMIANVLLGASGAGKKKITVVET